VRQQPAEVFEVELTVGVGERHSLEARGLEAGFGASQILFGVDLSVREGEIAGVLGLNGAGSTPGRCRAVSRRRSRWRAR
jgi:ABC-type histidine transport system ATPase subunit